VYSDINICKKRIIYDDCSPDFRTKEVLKHPKYINDSPIGFSVVRGNTNVGCRQSYVDALKYIKENISFDILITVDNDVVVKPYFISKMIEEFKKASEKYSTIEILLTGFNPTNSHSSMIEDNDTFYRKRTCGGVNYCFHKCLLENIIEWWEIGLDDNVMNKMYELNKPLCCVKPSVLNHVGTIGLHSTGTYWDTDENFDYSDVHMLEIPAEEYTVVKDGLYNIISIPDNECNKECELSFVSNLGEGFGEADGYYITMDANKDRDIETKKFEVMRTPDDKYLIYGRKSPNEKIYLLNDQEDKRDINSKYVCAHTTKKNNCVWRIEPDEEGNYFIILENDGNDSVLAGHKYYENDIRDDDSLYVNLHQVKHKATRWYFKSILE